MNYSLFHLVEETIHPKALSKEKITEEQETELLQQLRKNLECIFAESNSHKRILLHIRQLSYLSNTIYYYIFRFSPRSKNKYLSSTARKIYFDLLSAIEKTIGQCRQIITECYYEVPITHYSLNPLKSEMREAIAGLNIYLGKLPIRNKKLSDLVVHELYLFTGKKEITTYGIDYLFELVRAVRSSAVTNSFELVEMLYRNGFNPKSFLPYYSAELENTFAEIPDLHRQLELVIQEQDRFLGMPDSRSRMFPLLSSIQNQFKNFLSEKERFLRSIIDLRRDALEEEQRVIAKGKVKIFLSVPQLGLLIRVMLEKGIFAKDNIGELFAFFAANFSTPQAPLISPDSLRKKSTDVEFSTAKKLKGHLIGMLNWINENYNLSNFS